MENIRRNIRLFFATYGGLLFQIIGIIVVILFSIMGTNYLYKENTQIKIENTLTQVEIQEQDNIKKHKENISFISKFLDYCNNKNIEEAYNMLSEECIIHNYQTIDKFRDDYVNKLFTYKKEYKIQEENNLYKITILEGVLESGNLENRRSEICYYKIEENVLEKAIYIQGRK